ncbi:MAG: hypothetical protein WCC26_00940 [Terracidiphilus sp.]
MRGSRTALFTAMAIVAGQYAMAQSGASVFPAKLEAGSAFSAVFPGTGKATLYIVGPEGAVKRDVELGASTIFPIGSLYNAGHYLAFLAGGSANTTYEFDVVPASKPAELSFLARPSRLPVDMPGGITGALYVFDAYHNLITRQIPVHFELSGPSGEKQIHDESTRDGAAWTAMNSSPHQGVDKFSAEAGRVSSVRVIRQFPGDPCGLKMSASPSGDMLQLVTEPVRDCNGNAVPDGTVVTFTETYDGAESTVDVPLKRGIAQVEMPSHSGAMISVASGVVLGNQIRWER